MRTLQIFAGIALIAHFGLAALSARAEDEQLPPARVARGASLFAENCVTCHGARMRNPQWGIDLQTFPKDAKSRFVDSVTYGKRQMPPWEDVLSADDIEALWSYVHSGDPD